MIVVIDGQDYWVKISPLKTHYIMIESFVANPFGIR